MVKTSKNTGQAAGAAPVRNEFPNTQRNGGGVGPVYNKNFVTYLNYL